MSDGIGRERAARPEDLSRLLLDRLNAGDVDGLVALYEPDAALVLPGGGTATGREQIRVAFERVVAGGRTFAPGQQQPTLHSGDSGELALTSSRLTSGGITVEVARRQPDGTWLIVLDNPDVTA